MLMRDYNGVRLSCNQNSYSIDLPSTTCIESGGERWPSRYRFDSSFGFCIEE